MSHSNNKRIIEVVTQNTQWKSMYTKEAAEIKKVFTEMNNIYHIGSTAINNIKAKPTIDILIEVPDIQKVDTYNGKMEKLDYIPKGEFGIPGRRYFQKGEPQHTHHVHVFESGNEEIERHLNFRNYLNAHPEEASKYSQLKEKLARKYRHDASSYSLGKSDFIKNIDMKAKIWRERMDNK